MSFWICIGIALATIIIAIVQMFRKSMDFDAIGWAFIGGLGFVFLIGLLLGAFVWA